MNKTLIITAMLLFTVSAAICQKHNYKVGLVGFYNLENFYDTIDNPLINDDEFLPNSERHYNSHVYYNKIEHLSDVLSQVGTDMNPDGLALIGVAEIENREVLVDLCKSPKLKSRNLKVEHYDSPDKRGVDVGLLYNPKYFKVLNSAPLFVQLPGGSKDSYFTRDILYVKGIFAGDTVFVFVNHWPSRSGGEERSIPARAAAAKVARLKMDSILAVDMNAKIILMGDLNDDPISPSMTKTLKASGKLSKIKTGDIYNPWVDFYKNGLGTIAYQDSWGLFDQIVFSSAWLNKEQKGLFYNKAVIFNQEFMVQKTGKFKGYPKRTWDGMTYNYGYSDHFPTYLVFLKRVD